MLLRRPHDLAGLFRDGRARRNWSQSELAARVGVSRQWVSLVENGKTSVEFDLVLGALHALGYRLHMSFDPEMPKSDADLRGVAASIHRPSGRTSLTRGGEPLRVQRTRRSRSGFDRRPHA